MKTALNRSTSVQSGFSWFINLGRPVSVSVLPNLGERPNRTELPSTKQAGNPPPEPEANLGAAMFHELVESNRRQDRILTMLLEERSQSKTTDSKKPIADNPKPFDGSVGKLEGFLGDLCLCFLGTHTDSTLIISALSSRSRS